MSTAFSRSVRSLEADGFKRSIFGFLLVFVLLGAWTAWFFFARVAIGRTRFFRAYPTCTATSIRLSLTEREAGLGGGRCSAKLFPLLVEVHAKEIDPGCRSVIGLSLA